MGLFNKNNGQQVSQRQLLENKVTGGRSNILILLAFTVVNILLAVTNSNTYFLFSAYVPYALVDIGMLLCGMYPQEFYEEIYEAPYHSLEFYDKSIFYVGMVVAIIILAVYLAIWFFSKKESSRLGWLIFALVFFGIDTLAMLLMGGIAMDMILDYVFHGWVIYSLVSGILAIRKLKQLPEEVVEAVAYAPAADAAEQLPPEE